MPKTKPIRVFEMSQDEYFEQSESSVGYCLACGEQSDCCEPDARNYLCEACDAKEVFGLDELLVMGHVSITEDE